MKIDNKTIIIVGIVVGSICAMFLNYENLAITGLAGLVGYLSKENTPENNNFEDEKDAI